MTEMTALQKELFAVVEPIMRKFMKDLRREIATPRETEQPEWVTVKEAAAMLGVSHQTIRSRVKAGRYETRRDGGKIILIRRACITG